MSIIFPLAVIFLFFGFKWKYSKEFRDIGFLYIDLRIYCIGNCMADSLVFGWGYKEVCKVVSWMLNIFSITIETLLNIIEFFFYIKLYYFMLKFVYLNISFTKKNSRSIEFSLPSLLSFTYLKLLCFIWFFHIVNTYLYIYLLLKFLTFSIFNRKLSFASFF